MIDSEFSRYETILKLQQKECEFGEPLEEYNNDPQSFNDQKEIFRCKYCLAGFLSKSEKEECEKLPINGEIFKKGDIVKTTDHLYQGCVVDVVLSCNYRFKFHIQKVQIKNLVNGKLYWFNNDQLIKNQF